MSLKEKLCCSVRVPTTIAVTEITVQAEVTKPWLCFARRVACPVVSIYLDNVRREKLPGGFYAYPVCGMYVNLSIIQQLDQDCFFKIKVKRGMGTMRKAAIDARHLIQCLKQHHEFGKIHINLAVSSFDPFIFELQLQTKEVQKSNEFPSDLALEEIIACSVRVPSSSGMEEKQVETGNEHTLEKRDEEKDDIVEEEKMSNAQPSLNQQIGEMKANNSTEETSATHEQHDGASPAPLADHSEIEEEEKDSEAKGNLQAETSVAETRTSTQSIEQKLKHLVVEKENTSITTPPFTGFTSPIIVGVVWKKHLTCSGENNEFVNKEPERNLPPNNIMETKLNKQNVAVEEKRENKSKLDDQNDKCEAESTTLCHNKDKQTGKVQRNHSAEEKSVIRDEQSHKKKRTRRHGRKKKTFKKNKEKEANMMEEEKDTISFPERTLKQENTCEEDKVPMTEEKEMETGNEHTLEKSDEERDDIVEEGKMSNGQPSVKQQIGKMQVNNSTEETFATHEEQSWNTGRSRRRRKKKNKKRHHNVKQSIEQSTCIIKESSCSEMPPHPEEVPPVVTATLPTTTGKRHVTGVEREGAEHHTDEQEEERVKDEKVMLVVPDLMVQKQEEEAATDLMLQLQEEEAVPVVLEQQQEGEAVPVVSNLMLEQKQEEAVPVVLEQEEEGGVPVVLQQKEEEAVPEVLEQKEEEAVPVLLEQKEEEAVPEVLEQKEEEAVPVLLEQKEEEAVPVVLEQKEEETVPEVPDLKFKEKEDDAVSLLLQQKEEKAVPIVLEQKEEEAVPKVRKESTEAKNNKSSFAAVEALHGESAAQEQHISATYPPPPWQCPPPSYIGSLQALRQEILDFHRWAGGSEAESQRRMQPVEDVRGAVGVLWPAAQVHVTGSLANGLYLPDSDVDLTLVGQWPLAPSPLLVLRDALLQRAVALPASLKVVEKATVPLVKFVHQQTGVEVDVSLGGVAAVRAVVLVAHFKGQFNTLTPVVLFVRYYLKQLNLGQVFTGGVSSYAVTLMATSLLQLQVPPEERDDPALVLLRFFYFYGHQFSYAKMGISVLQGGRYLRKEDVPTVMPAGHRRADLCIQDPLTPGNDVGRSSFRVWEAQRAFQHAYLVLAPAVRAPGRYASPCSLLGQLLLGYGAPSRCLPHDPFPNSRQWALHHQVPQLPQQERHNRYHQQSSHLAAQQQHHAVYRHTLPQNNQSPRHNWSQSSYHHGYGQGYHYRAQYQQQQHHYNQWHDGTRRHQGQQEYCNQYYHQGPAEPIWNSHQQRYRARYYVKQKDARRHYGTG